LTQNATAIQLENISYNQAMATKRKLGPFPVRRPTATLLDLHQKVADIIVADYAKHRDLSVATDSHAYTRAN
jgi:hypothetical protein